MKTVLLFLALSAALLAAERNPVVATNTLAITSQPSTNRLHRMPPRNLRQLTNTPPTPQQTMLGPRYDVAISPGTGIIIISTNSFTTNQARQWLQEALRTLR